MKYFSNKSLDKRIKEIASQSGGDYSAGTGIEISDNDEISIDSDYLTEIANGNAAYGYFTGGVLQTTRDPFWEVGSPSDLIGLKSGYNYVGAKGLKLAVTAETDVADSPAHLMLRDLGTNGTHNYALYTPYAIISAGDQIVGSGTPGGGGGGGASYLSELHDVEFGLSPSVGQILVYAANVPLNPDGTQYGPGWTVANMPSGDVTSISVNGQTYSPSGGVVTLPNYPTIPSTYAWSAITSTPTTLSGYGITDASINNGVITLGSNSITPLTSHQTIYGLTLKVGTSTVGSYTPNSAAQTLTVTAQNLYDTIGSTKYHPYGGDTASNTFKIGGATLTWHPESSVGAGDAYLELDSAFLTTGDQIVGSGTPGGGGGGAGYLYELGDIYHDTNKTKVLRTDGTTPAAVGDVLQLTSLTGGNKWAAVPASSIGGVTSVVGQTGDVTAQQISTAIGLSGYLPLAGGSMTGTLGLFTETGAWNFSRNEGKLRFMQCGASAATGAPGSYYSGVSFVTSYNGFQLAVYANDNANSFRFRQTDDNIAQSTIWGAWHTIYHSGNFTPGNYVLKAGDTMSGRLTISSSETTAPLFVGTTGSLGKSSIYIQYNASTKARVEYDTTNGFGIVNSVTGDFVNLPDTTQSTLMWKNTNPFYHSGNANNRLADWSCDALNINRNESDGSMASSGTALEVQGYASYVAFKTYMADGNGSSTSVSTNHLVLDNQGYIGVRKNDPAYPLDVNGSARASNYYLNANGYIRWYYSSSSLSGGPIIECQSGNYTDQTKADLALQASLYTNSATVTAFKFSTGLTSYALTIKNDGKIGVGTYSPVTSLDVRSDKAGAISVMRTVAGGGSFIDYNPNNQTTYMWRVGANYTQGDYPFLWEYWSGGSSGSALMTLSTYGAPAFSGNAITFGGSDANSYLKIKTDSREWWVGVGSTSDDDKFLIYDATAGSNRFCIDTSGNVGVGTAVPDCRLYVNGDTYVKGWLGLLSNTGSWNITKNEGKIRLFHCRGTAADGAPGTYMSGLSVATAYNAFQFAVYGGSTSETLYFRKTGDSSPYWTDWRTIWHSGNSNLYNVNWVCATSYVYGSQYFRGSGSGTYNVSEISVNTTRVYWELPKATDSATGTNVPFYICWRGGGTRAIYINPTGYVGICKASGSTPSQALDVTGSIVSSGDQIISSDERLKANIKPVNLTVEQIAGMRAVTYDRKDSGLHSLGVIAQDWEKVLPESVNQGEYLTFKYAQTAMVSAIVLARHETEQDKEIRELKDALGKANGRINELEDEVKRLRS